MLAAFSLGVNDGLIKSKIQFHNFELMTYFIGNLLMLSSEKKKIKSIKNLTYYDILKSLGDLGYSVHCA